jgi:gliding motility-associated-like protein
MTVNPLLPVSVSIAADANNVCAGTIVTLTATSINGGITPNYQWNNGITPVGTNSSTYSYTPSNGDAISVILTSSEMCPIGGPVMSNIVNMIVNAVPTVTEVHNDITCFGTTTGSIDITVAGGTAPFTFTWTGAGVAVSSEDQSNLAAGLYSVVVSDANSCSSIALPVTIAGPASSLSGSITSQSDVSIFGGNDGSVTISGAGGTAPYLYRLGLGAYQVSGTFGTLTAGAYTITVQDSKLCTFDVSVTITQPIALISGSITSQTNVACFGTSTGSVTVAGSGGVAPYDYSIDGVTYQTSGTFGALASGNHSVTVRDASLNTFIVNVTITQPATSVGGTIISQTNVVCFGSNTGSVTVAGSGGTAPYVYKTGSGSFQASGTFSNLTSGTFTITVRDANLCVFDVSGFITQPLAALQLSGVTTINTACSGSTNGSISVSASGGTSPYMFSFNGGAYQNSGTFSGLAAGSYTISVMDASVCTASSQVTVTEPAVLSIEGETVSATCPGEADGSISLTITGGSQPYSIIWSDGVTTQNRTDIAPGSYSVVVTDKNGCASSLDVVLNNEATDQCIEIPDIITPNNDGYNDTWIIKNIDMFPNAEVFVFTRWGKQVFNTKNLSANPWNGTFKGRILPTDSYHYILHLNDGSKPRSGVISIIR